MYLTLPVILFSLKLFILDVVGIDGSKWMDMAVFQ